MLSDSAHSINNFGPGPGRLTSKHLVHAFLCKVSLPKVWFSAIEGIIRKLVTKALAGPSLGAVVTSAIDFSLVGYSHNMIRTLKLDEDPYVIPLRHRLKKLDSRNPSYRQLDQARYIHT